MSTSIRISELIRELQDSLERLGDVEVYTYTDYNMIRECEGVIESRVDNNGEADFDDPNAVPIVIID